VGVRQSREEPRGMSERIPDNNEFETTFRDLLTFRSPEVRWMAREAKRARAAETRLRDLLKRTAPHFSGGSLLWKEIERELAE
jgi:hypothetical protein